MTQTLIRDGSGSLYGTSFLESTAFASGGGGSHCVKIFSKSNLYRNLSRSLLLSSSFSEILFTPLKNKSYCTLYAEDILITSFKLTRHLMVNGHQVVLHKLLPTKLKSLQRAHSHARVHVKRMMRMCPPANTPFNYTIPAQHPFSVFP